MSTPKHLVDELRRIKADAEQSIRDVEWWNANRTDDAPLDCEVERVIVGIADRGLQAAERGDHATFSKVVSELAGYCTSAILGGRL